MKKIIELMGGIPFMLLSTEGSWKLRPQRIIEALIIAGIGGMVAAYMTTSELKIKLLAQEQTMNMVMNENRETCKIIQDIAKEVVRIDTLQKDRISREKR